MLALEAFSFSCEENIGKPESCGKSKGCVLLHDVFSGHPADDGVQQAAALLLRTHFVQLWGGGRNATLQKDNRKTFRT